MTGPLKAPCVHKRYEAHALPCPHSRVGRHAYYDGPVPDPQTQIVWCPSDCPGGTLLPEDRRVFWVQNADHESDLGDYSGYKQSDWDEAVGVAGELVSDGHWHDGIDAAEVLELLVVRSLIVKAPEIEDDE